MMATEGDGSENEEFEWEEKAEEAYRGKDVSATIDAADGIRAHEYILDQSSRSSKGTLWAASLKLSPALHAALLEEQGRSRSAAYGESMSIEFQSKGMMDAVHPYFLAALLVVYFTKPRLTRPLTNCIYIYRLRDDPRRICSIRFQSLSGYREGEFSLIIYSKFYYPG
jgi:hypothetical protein